MRIRDTKMVKVQRAQREREDGGGSILMPGRYAVPNKYFEPERKAARLKRCQADQKEAKGAKQQTRVRA